MLKPRARVASASLFLAIRLGWHALEDKRASFRLIFYFSSSMDGMI